MQTTRLTILASAGLLTMALLAGCASKDQKALDQAKEVQKTVDAQAAEQAKKIDDATK